MTLLTCCFVHHLYGVTTGQMPFDSTSVRGDSSQKIAPRTAPALSITGDLTLSMGYYQSLGSGNPLRQFSPCLLTGNVTLASRSGWVIPVGLTGSSQNNSYQTAYNQIGFSPRYQNWLTLHGGYRNVYFSPLTLAGHTVVGVGVELNPGLLRLGVMYGKFNRAIEANESDPEQIPVFRRMGYAVKMGLGNQQNYIDLILLNVADAVQSIRADALDRIKPAGNKVLGISSRLRLKKSFYFEFDAAGSAYTDDTRLSSENQPDASAPSQSLFHKLFTPRASTQVYAALQTSLSYKLKNADIKLQYKYVEPDYKSMGAYYFQTDIERLVVTPSVRLFRKRLSLRTSLGTQRNNLFNQKKVRTNRLTTSVSAAYTTDNNLTLDLAYANNGIAQQAGYRPLSDTLRIAQNNRTASGSVFKMWMNETLVHTLTSSAVYQKLDDSNPFTASFNQDQNWNYDVNYTCQHQVAKLDVSFGYTYTRSKGLDLESVFQGPSVEVSKRLLTDNRLMLRAHVNYLKSQEVLMGSPQAGSILNGSLSIDYQPSPVHRFSFNWSKTTNQSAETFHQQQGSLQYSMSF